MSRADKKAQYRDARSFYMEPHRKDDHKFMVKYALNFAHGRMHDFRFGMALCALLGISTCTGKPLH